MKQHNKTVMAIDPSLTGFSIVIINNHDEVIYKEMATKPAKTLEARIKRYLKLTEFAVDYLLGHEPDLVLIEGYSYGSRGAAVISLGEMGGILRKELITALYSNITDGKLIEVPPTTLKKFITGKGNAGKVAVATALAKRYNMEFKTDNHADAYGLARMGRCILDIEECETKAQQEAVDVIKKSMEES